MSKTWIYIRMAQIAIDAIGVYVAFLAAYFWRVGFIFSSDFPFEPWAKFSFVAAALGIGFLAVTKYYRIPPRSGGRTGFDLFLPVVGGIVAIAFLLATIFFETDYSRLINLMVLAIGVAFLILTQIVVRFIFASFKKNQKYVYRTLVVGANRVAEKIISRIEKDPYAPHRIIGVIDPYGLEKSIRGSRILGKLDRFEEICEKEKISEIIQCDAFEHTLNLISFCDQKNIKFQFEPALRGIFEENLRIRDVAGSSMISFVKRDFSGVKSFKFKLIDKILRQVFDVD